MHYGYGQTSERTQRIKSMINEVSRLALTVGFGIEQAENILDTIARDFPDDEEVFVTVLRTLLEQAVKDGSIDDRERGLIADLANVIANPISDNPVEQVEGKRIVLTGDFSTDGGKATVKKMIQAAKGRFTGSVSRRTDYVVVGS